MLTEEDLYRVFSWLQDRKDWPEDIYEIDSKINADFGDLIESFTNNKYFKVILSEDGTNSNYLEFICFPFGNIIYQAEAIMVCISLCSPISAYGQVYLDKTSSGYGIGTLQPKSVGVITDPSLIHIEKEIKAILSRFNLKLIDNEFASKPLPIEVDNTLKNNSAYRGNQYFHGIFQIIE